MDPAFFPFRRHPPDAPHDRFSTLPLSVMDFPRRSRRGRGFAFRSQARRHTRPYRVRHPTDWKFVSSCSPPRLTTTQLDSTTSRRAHA
jgi:hypothetical protein